MLRAIPVRDRVGRDAHARADRERLDVDLAHDRRDLIAPPLRPHRIVVRRRPGATGHGVEPRDRRVVVAPRRDVRAEVVVGIADAVEVDAVDVVAPDDRERVVDDPLRRVRVARVDDPVGVDLLEAVRPLRDPALRTRARSVGVERMVRRRRRSAASPDRRRDHPGMHLEALRVRLLDQGLQRVERCGVDARLLSARCERAIAEAVAAADDLRDDRVHVKRLR